MSVTKIAAYICQRYQKEFGKQIDEMKLHKLLYFTQRECLVQTGQPMFPEQLHAWKYGPVMPQIRHLYKDGKLTDLPSDEEVAQYQSVFDEVSVSMHPAIRSRWYLYHMASFLGNGPAKVTLNTSLPMSP